MDISIIIVTRNRCEDVRLTLESFAWLNLPDGCAGEVLVVDNGSTDETRRIVDGAILPHLRVRYLCEPARGKSRGLNLALGEACGRILVFTDDDVRPHHDWLVELTGPIRRGEAEATQGTILLGAELERPWMGPWVRASLSQHAVSHNGRTMLMGGNCAISRAVLDRVRGFDTHIGPPFAGGEDTLFSEQLLAAGFRIASVAGAVVTHHPHASRLERRHILRGARLGGASDAYMAHHWHHQAFGRAHKRLAKAVVKMWWHRLSRWRERRRQGVRDWEYADAKNVARWTNYLRESRKPRRYAKRGLNPL